MRVPNKEIQTMSKNLETLLNDWLCGRMQHNCKASEALLRGRDVYHFGTHYLALRMLPCGVILRNTYGYSMRTSSMISKVRGFLREEGVLSRCLPFDSAVYRWWDYAEKPALGHLLSEALPGVAIDDHLLDNIYKAYDIKVSSDGLVPLEVWDNDLDKLRDVLGYGEESALSVLHHVALVRGVASATDLVKTGLFYQNNAEAHQRLVYYYGGIDPVGTKWFGGYEGRFWEEMQREASLTGKAQKAAELLLKPSLKRFAMTFLNNYNNGRYASVQ